MVFIVKRAQPISAVFAGGVLKRTTWEIAIPKIVDKKQFGFLWAVCYVSMLLIKPLN